MNCIISASNAFAKWLKIELPRIPSLDGKKIGVQSLVTDTNSISWQCHVIRQPKYSTTSTIIAVEAYSRYAIIMPYSLVPSQKTFERDLSRHWADQMVHLMIESGVLSDSDVHSVLNQFNNTRVDFTWFKNTDLSVNGHVSDAEQWVLQSFERYGLSHFDEEEAFGLGLHINKMHKRAKSPQGSKQQFYPAARFVDDSLFRFANGLADDHYSGAPGQNFPNPYGHMPINTNTKSTNTKLSEEFDNVVSLSSFRNKSKR